MKHLAIALSGALAVLGAAIGTSAARNGGYEDAAWLRHFIDQQVGGIEKLKVPATDAEIPVAPPPAGNTAYRYETTEAKRYLGKLLFHDPVRTVRIDINQGQPVDLPAGTAFGGTVNASDPNIQNVVSATMQTGSCGSCHIGEAAGKAGQQLNFNVGGEGRGYTDGQGNFFPRRRPQSILNQQRSLPIFSGDTLVDALPTLTDVDCISGQSAPASSTYACPAGKGQPVVTLPAPFYHTPPPNALLATGRLDQLDSVGRESPALVGFAFNNRLLLGGFAGEPPSAPNSLNPFNDPAQENLTLLLLDAHRMLNFESAALLKIPAFVKLFRDAFPQEAAAADSSGDLTMLVNDQTVFRATSTFLRTIVTRNTPYDKFLAGDNRALTSAQLRGAKLFFTPAANGGAGCFSCHSGPMLNKQHNDPDVAGVGQFVEENFINVGIGDHPVQALNALARGHLNPNKLGTDGFPYHAEDTGRQEITTNPKQAFEFRVLTLRQLKDGRTFFHNGSFTSVHDVVEYFNAGVPQDPTAGAAPTLSTRFTNPRGPGYPNGLGLSDRQVKDLTDFLENGLYDPALVKYDPHSSTPTLQPNARDLTYSKYRPDLAALGAKDGLMLSGKAIDDNDPLSRRDQGIDPPIDVTNHLDVRVSKSKSGDDEFDAVTITNESSVVVDTHLLVVVKGLSRRVQLQNASGITSAGDPYIRVFLPQGVLNPRQSISINLVFNRKPNASAVTYSLSFLSGQGTP
jgi:cytochrome c peroxidase